ncbi:MAG: DUF3352 domain-containing protein, partial [Actinomycetota bacterium]|nr:DUF3352 domain-containing protein [Actinomycetota bacterium]
LYFEANLKPGDDVEELAKKLSGEEDPGGRIKGLIEKEARKTIKDFDYDEDIGPWLGERIALYAPRIAPGDDSPVAFVAATKDADKAKEFLEREVRRDGDGGQKAQVVERTHRGTKYIVDTSDDEGVAMVDDYAIFGTDEGIKGALDAKEGESLAESSEYEKARDSVEEDGAGFMYIRFSQLFSGLGPEGAAARQVFSGFGDTLAVGVDGDASSARLESAAIGGNATKGPSGPGEVFTQLPASAWLAAGVSDVGARIEQMIEQFSQLGALGGQDVDQLLDQFESQFGLDPRRDLASWMGDAGVFVFGDSPAEIGGGLVARVKDAGTARRALPRITNFLEQVGSVSSRPLNRGGIDTGVTLRSPEVPLPIHMALTDDERFIVAVTDSALSQALQDTEPLGESQEFKDAAGKLEGMEPSLFVNFAPIGGLVDATGAADQDPSAEEARKVLDKLTTLIAGGKREEDVSRSKVVVGVK